MSGICFIAVNDEALDSNVSLNAVDSKPAQRFVDWKEEYESITNLLGSDLQGAWKRLQRFLEGDLFATQSNLPKIKELQLAALQLALDVGRQLNEPTFGDWALEAVEWFSEEPFFWLKAAEATFVDGRALDGLKGLLFRREALLQAQKLLPGDFEIQRKLENIYARLGLVEDAPILCSEDLKEAYLPSLRTRNIIVSSKERLSEFAGKVLDMSEEILCLRPLKRQKLNTSGDLSLGIKLMCPISVQVGDKIDDFSAGEIDPLPLSQTGSIRNLREGASSSQPNRNGRKTSSSQPKKLAISNNEFCHLIEQSLIGVENQATFDGILNKAQATFNSQIDKLSFITAQEMNDDPFLAQIMPNYQTFSLAELLVQLLQFFSILSRPAIYFVPLFRRLASHLVLLDFEFVLPHLELKHLLWWGECLTKCPAAMVDDEVEQKLVSLSNLSIVNQIASGTSFCHELFRFYHLKYLIGKDEKYLTFLYNSLDEEAIIELPAMMELDGRIPIISRQMLAANQMSLQREKNLIFLQEQLEGNPEKIIKDYDWFINNIPLKDIPGIITDCNFSKEQLQSTSVQQFIFAGMFLAINFDDSVNAKKLLGMADSQVFLTFAALGLLEGLTLLTHGSRELFVCYLKLVKAIKVVDQSVELVVVHLLRDLEDVSSLNEEDFRLLIESPISSKTPNGWALRYVGLTGILGAPPLTIKASEEIIQELLDASSNLGRSVKPLDKRERIQYLSSLADLVLEGEYYCNEESIDSTSLVNWIEWMVPNILEDLYLSNQFYHANVNILKMRLFKVSTVSLNHCMATFHLPFQSTYDALYRLYEASQKLNVSFGINPKTKKKASIIEYDESPRIIYMRLATFFYSECREFRQSSFCKLRGILEHQLRQILSSSAAEIRNVSRTVNQLIIGIANCYNWGGLDLDHLERELKMLILFCESCSRRTLAIFVDRDIRLILLLFVKRNHKTWRESPDIPSYYFSILKMVLDNSFHLNLHEKTIGALEFLVSTTLQQKEMDLVYYIVCNLLEGILIESSAEENIDNFSNSLEKTLGPILLKEGGDNGDESNQISSSSTSPTPARDKLRMIFDSIIPRCSNKIPQFRSAALLSRLNGLPCTLDQTIEYWGVVLPFLIKPRTPNPFTIWQTDYDYHGDYYFYVEQYIGKAAQQIFGSLAKIELRLEKLRTIKSRVEHERDRNILRPKRLLEKLNCLIEELVEALSQQRSSLSSGGEDNEKSTHDT